MSFKRWACEQRWETELLGTATLPWLCKGSAVLQQRNYYMQFYPQSYFKNKLIVTLASLQPFCFVHSLKFPLVPRLSQGL